MGNKTKEFLGHTAAVSSISQSVEHEFVSGSLDGTARVWDSETGETKYVLNGHSKSVAVLTLPNGIVITGSSEPKVKLWYRGILAKEIQH